MNKEIDRMTATRPTSLRSRTPRVRAIAIKLFGLLIAKSLIPRVESSNSAAGPRGSEVLRRRQPPRSCLRQQSDGLLSCGRSISLSRHGGRRGRRRTMIAGPISRSVERVASATSQLWMRAPDFLFISGQDSRACCSVLTNIGLRLGAAC